MINLPNATVIAAAACKAGGAYDNHVTGVNTTHLPGISNAMGLWLYVLYRGILRNFPCRESRVVTVECAVEYHVYRSHDGEEMWPNQPPGQPQVDLVRLNENQKTWLDFTGMWLNYIRVRRSRGEMFIGHECLQCLWVCLSLAAFPQSARARM